MSQLHGAAGGVLLGASVALAVAAIVTALATWSPSWLDRLRIALAGLVVAEAAIGLVLAVRGPGPGAAIHWLYGAVLLGIPLAAGALAESMPARPRSLVVAAAATLMAFVAWRLVETG